MNIPAIHYAAAAIGFLLWTRVTWLYWRRYKQTDDPYVLGGVIISAFFSFLTLTPIWLFHERLPPSTILALQETAGLTIVVLLYLIRARR